MNKKSIIFITIVSLILIAVGCGEKDEEKSEEGASVESEQISTSEESEEEITEEKKVIELDEVQDIDLHNSPDSQKDAEKESNVSKENKEVDTEEDSSNNNIEKSDEKIKQVYHNFFNGLSQSDFEKVESSYNNEEFLKSTKEMIDLIDFTFNITEENYLGNDGGLEYYEIKVETYDNNLKAVNNETIFKIGVNPEKEIIEYYEVKDAMFYVE